MNASLSKKMSPKTKAGPARGAAPVLAPVLVPALALGLVLGLGGCAGAFSAETDRLSPVAPRVQALADAHRQYPRWEDFPAPPTDLPRPVQIAARVGALGATAGALAGEVAGIEWALGDAATFERDVAARIDAYRMAPVTARTGADIDAYAQTLRDRAKAPPPIDRRD